jgi:3-deoxy-D-manno-octulosonic-acid transferase
VAQAPLGYRIATAAVSPLLPMVSLWQALRHGKLNYFAQRQGLAYPSFGERPIWLHAASVGEVLTAQPLIETAAAFGYPLMVTTNTVTGASIANRHLPHAGRHCFLPWDTRGAVRRFLRSVNPRCALIMETEIWPNLYAACETTKVPIFIVNARLSGRTLSAPTLIRNAYGRALGSVVRILARSERDRDAYLSLGAPPERIEVCGNLKFASGKGTTTTTDTPIGRPYWLAASTHADEEWLLARAWRQIEDRDRLLVIAPRHPHRMRSIEKQLRALNMQIAVRSRGDRVNDDTRIYLADTLGELAGFMTHADWVFMGGSLATVGGHNLLEPARMKKAVLVGPHMHNFMDETSALLEAEGLLMIDGEAGLQDALARLNSSASLRTQLGTRAFAFVDAQSGVLPRYLSILTPLCFSRDRQ